MRKNVSPLQKKAIGIIKVHPRGFGFVQPQQRDLFPEDIFIPRHATKGAVDGDIVETTVQSSPKGPEGRVCKILKRGRKHVAGTIARKGKKEVFAYVPLLGSDKLMSIKSANKKLQVGDRVIIHVLDWGSSQRKSSGEVAAFIGKITDPSCDVKAAIEEFELTDKFSKQALDEAHRMHLPSEKDLKNREDFRSLECFTIDPESAKDFDDALSLSRNEKGEYELGVHIADVSHYVRPGSHLDKEAKERCNSTYFPGSVVPMLPSSLSNQLCSLKPKVDRLTASVMMTFDESGSLLHYRMCRSVIKSRKRFTYEEVTQILEQGDKSPYAETLHMMKDLCFKLKKKRAERGSIEFALPDTKVCVDEKGNAKRIDIILYDISHQIVEEFMLKANEIVATCLEEKGKPLTFRIHEEPNEENLQEFYSLARALGFTLSENPDPFELQVLFDEARSSAFGQYLATAFIRSMKLAAYSTENIGHYGLGLKAYTHFTSPIRRYIDLIVHRVLFDEMNPNEDLAEISLQCSERERLSAKAENSVVILKKLRLLQEISQQQPNRVFEAIITSVKPFGFIFEMLEFLMEGTLFLPAFLPNYYYSFDESEKKLKIRDRVFQATDRIQVKVKSIDLITRQAEWTLVPSLSEGKKKQKKK